MSDTAGPSGIGLPTLEDVVEIGRGGFATVYRARQPFFGRAVAVKLLDPTGDPRSLERFERECEAMGMLSSHPNIVTIFDAGVTSEGKPFLLMEYMPDGSLDDRLEREGALPWQEVAELGVKLSGALETAHEAGVLHRDVKPANVLRSSFGEPCLSDFGLARFGTAAKTTGVVTATILHAPPEILSGEAASARSDVYSLASSLYTLIAGDAPFFEPTDESLLPLLGRIADTPVPDLRARSVPDDLAAAIEAGMAKDPGARPPTARAFGERLQAAQAAAGVPVTILPISSKASVDAAATIIRQAPATTTGTPTQDDQGTIKRDVTPPSMAPPPIEPPPGKKRRWPLVAAVVVVLALIAGGAVLLTGGGGDDTGGDTTGGDQPTSTSLPTPRQAEAQFVDLVNEYRQAQGLPLLTVDPRLRQEARDQADVVAEAGRPVTRDLQEIGNDYPNAFGTILANTGGGGSVEEAHQAMLDNDEQRQNLERGDVNVMGVGVTYSEDGEMLWVVEYLGGTLD